MTIQHATHSVFTLGSIFTKSKWKISFTVLLVVVEAVANVLFPLFIGFAINGLLIAKFDGLVSLAVLGMVSLVIGAGRRLYDSRLYANVYMTFMPQLVDQEQKKNSSVSKIAARTRLFTEFVEFLENSFPELVHSLIGLFGTLLIILSLGRNVFFACLAASVFVLLVYLLGGNRNFALNKGYNDEIEKQVDELGSEDENRIFAHFKNVACWNIKLSDFETLNFSIVWIGMIALLLFAVVAAIESGITAYGTIFSIIVYVFEFIGSVVVLPLYYQQLIRLHEISSRVNR